MLDRAAQLSFAELLKLKKGVDAQVAEQKEGNSDPLFESFISFTLDFEGGYSNDPSDPGGPTMFGLASRWHPQLKAKIISGTLTEEEAKQYVKEKYFDTIIMVHEVDPGIGFLVFDSRFHGNLEVIRYIQSGVNALTGAALRVDGIWGRKTAHVCAALSKTQVDTLIKYIRENIDDISRSAANRVIRYQKRNGMPVYDYYNGFKNRNVKRVAASESIRETYNV